jgi:hypothetical protein
MSLLTIVIVLILAGVGLYLVNSVIPMEATMKKILNIVVITVVALWVVFTLFGTGGMFASVSIPHLGK